MSLPASEPIPMPEEELPPARRRRMKRLVVPESDGEQGGVLDELGKTATPGAEFYTSSLLAGLVAGIGFLLDSPALIILAALLAPFMGPLMGVTVATIAGSASFMLTSLGSLAIGGVIFLLTGSLAGFAARIFPPHSMAQAGYHVTITWPDIILLVVGMVLTLVLMVRSTQQRPLVSSVAVAYAVYLPLSAAGYGLTSGALFPWEGGLLVFVGHLVVAVLTGTLTLVTLGLRPMRMLSYILTGTYALACLAGGLIYFLSNNVGIREPVQPQITVPAAFVPVASATVEQPSLTAPAVTQPGGEPTLTLTITLTPQPQPSATPAPTNTLVPTRTPTITVTPQATPVWARINVKGGNGAYIRSEPKYDALIVISLLNGNVVEVLPDVLVGDGVTWAKVRTADGKEGWIVRSLLATATPAPGW
jgi:hypothetical protein